jgi:hypothetical protein
VAIRRSHHSSVTNLLEASNVWEARNNGSADWQPEPQKPFTDMLRVALLSGDGRRLRVIAEKLAEKAEQGDIQAIREVGDRLDGKVVQAIERGDGPIEAMTDQQLMAIIRGGSREPLIEPELICGPIPDAE